MMRTLWIENVGSTNSYVKENMGALEPMTMVAALCQTAGRGQRGNSWEAEPGMNLTFSFHFAPRGVRPAAQFAISEAVALAMTDALARFGIEASVKWPNDIYVGDGKIAGILIENTVMGTDISSSVVGIGLNVNQTRFVSGAPNPVSMKQLSGETFSLGEVASVVGEKMELRLRRLRSGKRRLHSDYMARLRYNDRRPHRFRDAASGEVFNAVINGVELSGHLHLLPEEGAERTYAFKEVAFL